MFNPHPPIGHSRWGIIYIFIGLVETSPWLTKTVARTQDDWVRAKDHAEKIRYILCHHLSERGILELMLFAQEWKVKHLLGQFRTIYMFFYKICSTAHSLNCSRIQLHVSIYLSCLAHFLVWSKIIRKIHQYDETTNLNIKEEWKLTAGHSN